MIKEWSISIVNRGKEESMELWAKNGGMYKGYRMNGSKAEDRKSLVALLGWASIGYSVPAYDIKIDDSLIDLLSD